MKRVHFCERTTVRPTCCKSYFSPHAAQSRPQPATLQCLYPSFISPVSGRHTRVTVFLFSRKGFASLTRARSWTYVGGSKSGCINNLATIKLWLSSQYDWPSTMVRPSSQYVFPATTFTSLSFRYLRSLGLSPSNRQCAAVRMYWELMTLPPHLNILAMCSWTSQGFSVIFTPLPPIYISRHFWEVLWFLGSIFCWKSCHIFQVILKYSKADVIRVSQYNSRNLKMDQSGFEKKTTTRKTFKKPNNNQTNLCI